METSTTLNRKGLKVKFAALYILSLALIAFIISVFIPRMGSSANITSAKPLENSDVQGNDILDKIEMLNVQYQNLKKQDQDYSGKVIESANASELNNLQRNISESEKALSKKLDSVDLVSKSYSSQKASGLLHSFVESFRFVMNDRNAMQSYKASVLSSGNANTAQQDMLKLQNEVQARNSRITALESQIRGLESKQNTTVAVTKNPAPGQQNNNDALQTTINNQENKIANLTAANAALEKELKANNDALDQLKKSSDNSSSVVKNQTSVLEKRVNDLNAEIRFAQVDCNLARVDATQIISNAKQRKLLLADALNTLNTLSATGDATVKKKAMDKMNRLNQIASTVRD